MCPADDCNATQTNLGGELVVMNYNDAFEGTPATTAAQCCEACKLVPDCNVWVFLNSKESLKEFPGYMCTLKKHVGGGSPKLFEVGEFMPWLAGFLADKVLPGEGPVQETEEATVG